MVSLLPGDFDMIKRFIIAAILVALFLGGLAYFQFIMKPEMIRNIIAQSAPPPETVSAEPAKQESWERRLHSIGSLTATQSIDVSSQVPGIVDEILFKGGSNVKKGTILVRLDTQVERADLASNQATLKQAGLQLDRQQDLVRRGAGAQARLDEAQAERDTAAAAVQRTEALIAQKTVKAPFAGRLGIRNVNQGQYVSAGMALVTLQALDPIYMDFPVPEQHADVLAVGQKVEVTFNSMPGETFSGEVIMLDARVSTETRTLQVRGQLANKDGKLLPGMFANVAVVVGKPREVVTLPRTAVTYSLYGDSVFAVQAAQADETAGGEGENGEAKDEAPSSGSGSDDESAVRTVERRFVKLGEVRGDRVVIAEGIKAGEEVVTSGQIKLKSGGRVRLDNSSPLTPPLPTPRQ